MSIITAIIPALIALDLLWWFSADRLLRKTGWKRRARILHSLFFGFQLAALIAVLRRDDRNCGTKCPGS